MTPSRRTLLGAGLGLTAAFAARTDGGLRTARAGPDSGPPLNGRFSIDARARAEAARDFGNIVHRSPRAVFQPASRDDVAELIRWAGTRGLKVVARGQGHSTYGRALLEDGVVIDMNTVSAIHDLAADRVVVDAGATWRSVLEATLPHRLTPPVLTNHLDLSVGGTIAVGGIGGSSSRHGMQTDHVLELEVVTGEGRTLTCSAGSNRDLFDAVRGGLAQCGIVTRAALKLVRAPERVRRFQLFYPDLATLTADQSRALKDDRFDQLQGAILPGEKGGWRYQLDGAVFYGGSAVPDDKALLAEMSDDRSAAVVSDLSYRDDTSAFTKFEEMLKAKGQWFIPQPWLFSFLPARSAEHVAGEILGELSGEEIGPFGRITWYPIHTGAFQTPLVRLPDENVAFVFNIVRILPAADSATVGRMIKENRALYERISEIGGVHYPVSALPMTPEDWQAHFGSRWPLLQDAKRRHDPNNLIAPGYNLF